ncbi:MAG: porin [Bradymonadia bacterium]
MNVTLLGLAVALLGDLNVAGSVYLNQPTLFRGGEEVETVTGQTARGLNAETSLKLIADVDDHVTVQAKMCYGCHGLITDMAYVDYTIDEALVVRAGRFPVPFGGFYLRYDPANHKTASKPLPYEMGRMLRRNQFNLAVVPEPYPDNGIQLTGQLRGDAAQFRYALYAVAGLKGNANVGDLDFIQSRNEYFADNNRTPTVGARATLAFFKVWMFRVLEVGLSGLWGHYDEDGELYYGMAGVDLYARIGKVGIRAEVLGRRTEIPNEPTRFRQQLVDLWVQREAFYLAFEGPIIGRTLEWVLRWDGFRRSGPVPIALDLPDEESSILRYTGGIVYSPTRSIGFKINYELWDFDDFDDEHLLHTGVVGTF